MQQRQARYLPTFYFKPLRMWFGYMNRIASREGTCSSNGENGLGSASFAYCIVLFYRNIRSGRAFLSILSSLRQPRETTLMFDPRTATAPFPLRDCRKDRDKVISYFRLSLRFSNTRTFGNWRTVESISTTYLFAKLLGLYVTARYGSNEVRSEVGKKSVSYQ